MKNRIQNILSHKKGSTIMYVLAVMLLLLAVGVSVLTAAAANVGFTGRQRDHTQATILADSIHQTIMYELQSNTGKLSDQLVLSLYEAYIYPSTQDPPSSDYGKLSDIELNVSGLEELNSKYTILPIKLSFPEQNVIIHDAIPEMPGLIDGEPASGLISCTMIVEVTVSITSRLGVSQLNTAGYYRLIKAELTGDSVTDMSINQNGIWELERYEVKEFTTSTGL